MIEIEKNERLSSDIIEALNQPADDAGAHYSAPVDADEIREISAEEALAELQAGKPLERVRVNGLKLRGEFTHPVVLRNVVLDRATIQKATFHENLELQSCTVTRLRFEKESTFAKDFVARFCTIKRTKFAGFVVQGSLRFDRSQFLDSADFNHIQVTGSIRFWEAHVQSWLQFSHCTIQGDADLRSVHVCEGASFDHCLFGSDFLFRGTTVEKKLDFGTSHFDGSIDLAKAKLRDFVYLESISQGPKQRFSFANCVVDRLLIKPTQLAGRVASEEAGDHELAMREYGLLKGIFQTLHRFDEEDWAFYRFKINQRKAKPRSWNRPWTKLAQACDYLFLDLGCGYGTNPTRAVTSAVLMILFFASVYAVGYHHFDVERPPIAEFAKESLPNRLVYSLMVAVSVFTSGFGGDQFSTAHGWVLLPLNIEALLGTLLWGLFVVAFSRKVIR